MAANESARPPEGAAHEVLVAHLVRCMEREGLEIVGADIPGHPKPQALKRLSLRPSRARPDVVARDGRRTIFGEAKSGSQIAEGYVGSQLESFARNSRLLIVCVSKEASDRAVDVLLDAAHTQYRSKFRLLVYPEDTWEDLSKAANRKRLRELEQKSKQVTWVTQQD
jgi:hypothetical protein